MNNMEDKYVVGEVTPEAVSVPLNFSQSLVMAVVSTTQHLDITGDEQIAIADSVMSVIRRFASEG